MKPLTGAAVGVAVIALVVPVGIAATLAICLTDPPACASEAERAEAVPGTPYDPHDGAISAAELDAISRAIGSPVPGYSILRDPDAQGTGWGGPSVNMLAPDMKLAVARLEIAIGQRLDVVSGYRTAGYQAQLCPTVTGPCAPPGRSMHQHGLAVDVTNWPTALAHLDRVGLCQPLPVTDAGHLSHHTGREC